MVEDRKSQTRLEGADNSLLKPYQSQELTEPLRKRRRSNRRLEPREFSLDLSRLAEGKSYRGPCRIESFSGDHGKDEPIVVVYPPYEEGERFDLLIENGGANLYKALVELSERVCSTDDLGDEALGLCYSPSTKAVALTEQFVRAFGLLEWDKHAGCDCVGDQARFGRIEIPYALKSAIDELEAVEQELASFDGLLDEASEPSGVTAPNDEPGKASLLDGLDLRVPSSVPGLRVFGTPFRFDPPSPAERWARLKERKASLEKKLLEETEQAKVEPPTSDSYRHSFYHYVSDRFYWLHSDFFSANPEVEHANAVGWILQEALALRRAARIWDALRRYRLGDKSDVVASLWRKRPDGRLWLFDHEYAPLKPSHRVLIFWTELHLQDLINSHIGAVRPQAGHSYFPPDATIGKTDLRRSKARLRFLPRTPLSSAWLQLFDDILNDRASGRICQECHEVFEPTRTDQVFCSSKCSNRYHQRVYRTRNKR